MVLNIDPPTSQSPTEDLTYGTYMFNPHILNLNALHRKIIADLEQKLEKLYNKLYTIKHIDLEQVLENKNSLKQEELTIQKSKLEKTLEILESEITTLEKEKTMKPVYSKTSMQN